MHFFLFFDGLKRCGRKVISAQCPGCQSDVNSNKRGAQASARVDVPTAPSFTVRTKESNTCASLELCTAGNRP